MKDPIVILHGWGSLVSGQKRFGVVKQLLEKKGYVVFTPDLPGFGSNSLVKDQLFFKDYIDFVTLFLKKHKLKKVILIGHSFGGRIAIAVAKEYPELISKLILASASGIPRKLSLKKMIAQLIAKTGKHVFTLPLLRPFYQPLRKFLYVSIGEMDYYKARHLEKTFKNVYRVDVSADLPKIGTPTLIVWGEDDSFTPVADGMLMHEKIKNSKLTIVADGTHRFPYERPSEFVSIVLDFLS